MPKSNLNGGYWRGKEVRFNFPYLRDNEGLDDIQRFKKIHINNSQATKPE